MNEKVIHISNLLLASGSPRRAQLLQQVGAEFIIAQPDIDESVFAEFSPKEQVMNLSRMKALGVSQKDSEVPVVAADTLVALENTVLGKPFDHDDAFRMLRTLSGKWHQVYTGVTVVRSGNIRTGCEITQVKFRELEDAEIWRYIATGEPLDKAGAYGIQEKGALLVERIDGDFYNVVGLPLVLLSRLLNELGCRLTD